MPHAQPRVSARLHVARRSAESSHQEVAQPRLGSIEIAGHDDGGEALRIVGFQAEQIALQRATLRNGSTVILAERHEIPVVQVSYEFNGGYASDPAGKEGVADFSMDLLDEGG